MTEQKHFKFDFKFIEPSKDVMETATSFLTSPDENCGCVAKAVLDVTAAGRTIQDALIEDRDVDMAPYFDFWFADSIACAQKLVNSDDKKARSLAQSLIAMEKAVIKSKESFLAEMKRLGVRPTVD